MSGKHPVYSDDFLLSRLNEIASKLGRPPKKHEVKHFDIPSDSTYVNHFGSWSDALQAADLETRDPVAMEKIPEEELLEKLKNAAEEVGRAPTQTEFSKLYDSPSESTYRNRFGSWPDALKAAGLDPKERERTTGKIPEDVLKENIRRAADDLDRVPMRKDMEDFGSACLSTYTNRFGSWNEALLASGISDREPDDKESKTTGSNEDPQERKISKKTLVTELKAGAEALGRPPTTEEMRELGEFSPQTYRNRFGSWEESLEAAGVDSSDAHRFAQKPVPQSTNQQPPDDRSGSDQAITMENTTGCEVSCECGLKFTFQSPGDASALKKIHDEKSGHSASMIGGSGESTEVQERKLNDRDIETLSLILPTVERSAEEAIYEFLSPPLSEGWKPSTAQYLPEFIQRIEDARADVDPVDRWRKIRSQPYPEEVLDTMSPGEVYVVDDLVSQFEADKDPLKMILKSRLDHLTESGDIKRQTHANGISTFRIAAL